MTVAGVPEPWPGWNNYSNYVGPRTRATAGSRQIAGIINLHINIVTLSDTFLWSTRLELACKVRMVDGQWLVSGD